MRLWALLAALLLGTMVLAGCSDDDGGDADPTPTSTSTGTQAPSPPSPPPPSPPASTGTTTQPPTPPPGEPDNSAPAGSISAVPAVNVLRTVNFTVDGADPDGDNMVWDLFFGDGQTVNGATFPANVSHQYPANGTYNVTFSITDGRLQASYNITVNSTATIAAPVAPGGGAAGFLLAGEVAAYCLLCGDAAALDAPAMPSASWASGEQGVDGIFSAMGPELVGHPYTLTSTGGSPNGFFMAACAPDAALVAGMDATGTVPAGAGCALLTEFPPFPPAPNLPVTLTLTVT